jgi:hypothetical protein
MGLHQNQLFVCQGSIFEEYTIGLTSFSIDLFILSSVMQTCGWRAPKLTLQFRFNTSYSFSILLVVEIPHKVSFLAKWQATKCLLPVSQGRLFRFA